MAGGRRDGEGKLINNCAGDGDSEGSVGGHKREGHQDVIRIRMREDRHK